MRDGEWTLAYGSESFTFGLPDSEATLLEAPDLGDVALVTGDVPRARADGVGVGVDFRAGRTVTFDLGIFRRTEAEALEVYERLSRAWRADKVRKTPGAVATLTARRAGRERVLFGRPRRFAEDLDLVAEGVIRVLVDFAATDDVFYASTPTSATVALVPPLSGGLAAPLASPLTSTSDSDRSVSIAVAGSLPAWPVIEISGPITSPEIEVVGAWRMAFSTTLAEGQTLRVDTVARTITRDGAPVPGVITRTSVRLGDASIPPGAYEVAFRGLSEPGTAFARLSWRSAFPSL